MSYCDKLLLCIYYRCILRIEGEVIYYIPFLLSCNVNWFAEQLYKSGYIYFFYILKPP